MIQYFAYIRVSTTRQGEGASLPQQRDAIERYAQRNQLQISRWFEEQETAAKQGRPIFGELIRLLKRGAATGVIIHKIDRSARNLRDWADLGDLTDRGVEIHFANEALDMSSRGGRLSADIQAVVAADYVRNLREEAKKGFYGRLKQGYFPMPAPLGYSNNGAAQVKTPDPRFGPLVRSAFELYATGKYNLVRLQHELYDRGLRRPNGTAIPINRLSDLLNNPFYYGLIQIKKTKQSFAGAHLPLISKRMFDQVQEILQGKVGARTQRHDFLHRRRLSCKSCEHSLIGETHKGFIYYRCQSAGCPPTCVREEAVETAILEQLIRLQLRSDERTYLAQKLATMRDSVAEQQGVAIQAITVQLSHIEDRLNRLTDAFIDRMIDEEMFTERKTALLAERQDLAGQLREWQGGKRDPVTELGNFLERAHTACLAYKNGTIDEKREVLSWATSNRLVDRKTPMITLTKAFQVVANRENVSHGGASRYSPRTCSALLTKLIALITTDGSDVRQLAA